MNDGVRLILAGLLAACTTSSSAETNVCPAPPEPVFSCVPIGSGSVGCVGSCRRMCNIDETIPSPGDDATFPVGCTETLTFCTPYFPDEAQTCYCVSMGSDAPIWSGGC